MKVLMIIQHDNKSLADSVPSLYTACTKLNGEIDLLLFCSDYSLLEGEVSKIPNISKIIAVEGQKFAQSFLSEDLAPIVADYAKNYDFTIAASSTFSKNFMANSAALLDVALISDVVEIVDQQTFKRPIYAGNAIATVQSSDKNKLITIRSTTFNKVELNGSSSNIEKVAFNDNNKQSEFIEMKATKSDRPELTSAKIVVSGGRGVGSKENFSVIEKLADKLGAAVGASRAAVDAGYVPNDYKVGQTGKIVAPELYIAAGISGAIQHLAGMKDSKIIVAINKDENAPIFEVADIGIVSDLFKVIPEFEDKI